MRELNEPFPVAIAFLSEHLQDDQTGNSICKWFNPLQKTARNTLFGTQFETLCRKKQTFYGSLISIVSWYQSAQQA